jgi:hypothetical protein
MGFFTVIFVGLVSGVILGVVTKKPAVGVLGIFVGALLAGVLSNMSF